MAEIDIHGKKVKYNENSESTKYAIEYLQRLDSSEAKNYFKIAAIDRYSRFETPNKPGDNSIEHDMTLEYDSSEGSYRLRKRTRR